MQHVAMGEVIFSRLPSKEKTVEIFQIIQCCFLSKQLQIEDTVITDLILSILKKNRHKILMYLHVIS